MASLFCRAWSIAYDKHIYFIEGNMPIVYYPNRSLRVKDASARIMQTKAPRL